MISPGHRPLPDNTQHSQQTDINDRGGIRARNLSRRTDADRRLRTRGHWDRPFFQLRPPPNQKNHAAVISTDNPAPSLSSVTHFDTCGTLSGHSYTEYSLPISLKSSFKTSSQVMPQPRRSVAGFSLRGPGFYTTAVLV